MTTGNRIEALRLANHLSQKELGRKVGVSGAQISNYEKNKDSPPRKRVERLAQNLHTTPEYITYDIAPTVTAPGAGVAHVEKWGEPGGETPSLIFPRPTLPFMASDYIYYYTPEFLMYNRWAVDGRLLCVKFEAFLRVGKRVQQGHFVIARRIIDGKTELMATNVGLGNEEYIFLPDENRPLRARNGGGERADIEIEAVVTKACVELL